MQSYLLRLFLGLVASLAVSFPLSAQDVLWRTTLDNDPANRDTARHMALLANGDLVVGGQTGPTSVRNFIVYRLNGSTGAVMWTRALDSGFNSDDVNDLIADPATGDTYICGRASSSGQALNWYVMKINGSNGTDAWAAPHVYDRAGQNDEARALFFSPNDGHVVVVGTTSGADFSAAGRLVKLNSSTGAQIWQVSTSQQLWVGAADASGNIFCGGETFAASNQATITKFNSSGTQQWHQTFAPSGGQFNRWNKIGIDTVSGDVITAGLILGPQSNNDIGVARYRSSDGLQLWNRLINGTFGAANDQASALVVEAGGDAYVTGNYQATSSNADWYVARLNIGTGAITWEKTYNGTGTGSEQLEALQVVGSTVYLAGYIVSTAPPATTAGRTQRVMKLAKADGSTLLEKDFFDRVGPQVIGNKALIIAANGDMIVSGDSGVTTNAAEIARFGTAGPVATAPTVTTATQSAVTATSATLGGNVTADGGATVTERGIVWKTSTGPTTADNKVQNGSGTGVFSGTVNSLPAGTTVFVRAYAINSVNTSYGNEISFTTLTPTASINRSPSSVSEDGATNLTYTVTLSSAVPASTTVNITTTGTATSGTDYSGAVTTLTIPANTTTGTITIDPFVDGTVETDETVILTVAAGTGYTVGVPASATGTILNDDVPAATIAVSPANVAEDGAPNLIYTVTLNQASFSALSVGYTVGGTATNGTDYATVTSPLVIPAGTTTGTITVNPTADATIEANETVTISLAAGAGYVVGVPNSVTGTILNDDLPNLVINDVTANEGNAGTTNFTFTVSLSAPAGPGGVTFDIATANGSATTANSDYVANSLTGQTIPTGSSTYTFTVQVTGDIANEPSETFFVNVTNVVNAVVVDGQGVGTIVNDDPLPSLSVNDVSVAEGNAGTATLTFTVTLSAASGQTVTVNYATADGTATTAGSDYTATSGTLTFTPGQTTRTINVSVNGDTSIETNETFFANLSGATNATISDNQGQGTITNDDVAADIPMTLTGGNLTINAGSAPGGAQVVLRFVAPNLLEIFDSTRTLGAPAGGTQVDSNTVRIPIASLTGGITLTGSASADVFTLDFSAGDICPPGGIAVNGGAPTTSPGDLLVIDGDFSSGGAYGTGSPGAGTLTLDTGNTVTFTGLEPVDMSAASFTDFTVTVDPGNLFSGNVITTIAAADAGVNTNISFGASGLESAKLGTVTGTLTINGDNVEHDYFVLQGLGTAMTGHFVVDALGGDSDVIEINNTTFTVAGLNKNLSLKADFIGLGRVNAVSPADNPGGIVCSGNITLEADGDSTVVTPLWGASGVWGASAPAYFNALQVPYTSRGTVQMMGDIRKTAGTDATLTLKGKHSVVMPNTTASGGTSPAGSIVSTSNKLNIILNADSDASGAGNVMLLHRSVVTTNGGSLTIGGGADPATLPTQGIAGATTTAPGVSMISTTITTAGGDVSIRGRGASSASGVGVLFNVSAGSVNGSLSTGAGNVTIVGNGGSNLTNCFGYFMLGNATAPALDTSITTTTGNVTITGTTGALNIDGIRLLQRASITSSSAGTVSLTGTGQGTGFGIMLNPSSGNTTTVQSTGGSISLIANKMNLNGGAGVESITTGSATSGSVTLKGFSAGIPIALGSGETDTDLLLAIDSATELPNITAGTVTLGDPFSAALTVTSVIAPSTFTTLGLASGTNNAFTATGGFTADVTSSSVYEKVTVTGSVILAPGATLTLNPNGYIWNGTDAFTILDNNSTDAIAGTFTGPTLTNFLGSTLTAQQSYSGGTGNDLVFSAPPSANADLAAFTTTAGALSPAFGAATTSYNTPTVPNATASVTVTATRAQANATLAVQVNGGGFTALTSGTASGALALNVGGNTIQVRVTAQDTTTTKIYTINVTRSAPPGAPTITSVAPARAPLAGGTTVVITGTDFTGATGVTIGGTAATGVVVDSPTQITATVPLGTSGISDITVTTGLGTGTGSGLFYYYAASGGPVAMAASKVDIFTPNGAGKVLPGAPIQYRTLIANTGGTDATTVDFADAIPANTTLVPGSVNVSPLAEDNIYTTIVNTQLAAGSPTVLSGPVITSTVKVTDNDREFTVSGILDTYTISVFDATSSAGGSVAMVTSGANMGSFTYVPPVGFIGADSFTYTIRDDGTDSTAGNADDLTGIGTVVINVTEADTVASGTQKVWYIDNSYAGANGAENGTSARPFNALSDITGASPRKDAAGDILYLGTGSVAYTGGITLLADQTFIGANTALVLNSITLAAAGTDPVITNSGGAGITLATNNTITGMAVANTSTFDIDGGAVGNLTIANTICNGTGGIINISTSGALNVAIAEASTTSAATGISLTGCSGTFTAGSVGSITGVTGTEINLSGGTMNFTYSGGITSASNSSIIIASRTGGTATLAGLVNITGGTGVSLTSNTGSTISFTGGLTVSTGTSAAFTATGGGTVNVTGANNTLTTTTATALNVANTTIGASGLTFQSISAGTTSGTAGVGISLDTTGSLGGLTVTGTGSAGSGGTIQRKTGANLNRSNGIGIYLNNTARVSLSWMQLNDFDNFAIRGFGVSGFTLTNCVINGVNGNSTANLGGTDELGEGAVYFGNAGVTNSDGLNGNVGIINCTIQGGSARNLSIADTASTSVMHATIAGCTFGLTQNLLGGNQSLAVEARNSGTTSHVSVSNSTFTGSMSDAMNFTGQTGTTMHVTVNSVAITNTHPGNNIGGGSMVFASQGIMFFDARNNTMSGANGSAVTIFKASAGTQMEGTFDSNTIGTSGVADSGSATGNGIFLSASGAGAIKLAITNNIIQRYSGNAGIYADNTDGSYTVDMTVTGNTLRQPGAGVFAGLAVTNGSPSSADTTNVFLRALNNNFADGDPNNVNDVIVGASGSAAGTHTFTLSGATAGDVASEAAIEAFIKANNNLSGAAAATVVDAYVDAPVTFSAFKASASLPAAPGAPLPLLFAETEPGTPDLTPASKTVSEAKTAVLTSKTAAKPVLAEKALTNENLQKLVFEAKARWIASGLTSKQKAALEALRIEISDLNELHLGQAAGDLIQISRTAAGNAWFIDQTPSDDAEFELRHSSFVIRHSAAGGGVDLLTTLMHEMGHRLGLPDTYALRDRSSIMYGYLTRGERRLPAPGEAAGATPFNDDTTRFLGDTINIGTLPAGKSVTIVGTVLVNDPANTQLISSQGTVSGGNFASVLTDDPAFVGAADPTTTPVERPDATIVSASIGTTPTNAPTLSWTVTFSTAVSNVTASNFALANTGLTAPSITSVTAIGPQPTDTWSVTVSTGTGSGSLGLNMVNDSGSLSHDITNLPFTGQVYTIDKIVPVFNSITRQTPSAQNTNADTLVFRAAFSETVLGVDAADFTVSGTTATISGITGTGPYDITLSGGNLASLNGTVGINLALTHNIFDSASNRVPDTEPAIDETYTVDNTAPTVAMTSATGNPAANAVIPVTVQFSETVTGFDLTDITVAGGSKGNFVAVDGDTYTFDLTPTGPGVTVTADIAANAAQDAATNGNTAATQFTRSIVDAVSIAATTATAAEGGATGLYTFTRGASTGDLTVSFQLDASSTATAATDFNLTSGGTLTFTPGTGAGTLVIPNGSLTATVTLTALAETPNPAEAAETARLNVVAASGYVVGGSPNATVTITENSFLVTTTNDSGTGSLRQAVLNANSIAGTDTITFSDGTGGTVDFTDSTTDTITLTSGEITLSSPISISGTGTSKLAVSGNNASRVFTINGSAGTVSLSDFTITAGSSTARAGFFASNDTLILSRINVENCVSTSTSGGFTFNGNTLRMASCAVRNNQAATNGGGANIQAVSSAMIMDCTFSGNSAGDASGGFFINRGTVINSTISGNTANGAATGGGGVRVQAASPVSFINCTITNNSAPNAASGARSGLWAETGTVNLANSLIAGNGAQDIAKEVANTITNAGGNLLGENTSVETEFPASATVGTNASPLNPQLAALANNGGPTQTHALLSGSPALNAGLPTNIPVDTFDLDGDTNVAEPLPFDQRGTGFTRAIGTVDIGAFELQKSVSIGNLAAISEGNSGTTNFVFTITRTGDTTGDVNMTYTVSGAAVNGTDFVGGTLPTGTATITSGNATTTVTIPVSGDTTVEPNEAFTVTLSAPDNGYVISGAPATSTINNDDTATVSIAKITDGAEANAPTNGKFRVTQTAASSTDTTVAYTVTGTATSGTDFTALSGSVTIPADSTTADIDVTVLNEGTTLEPTETVILTVNTVTSVNNVTLGSPATATMNLTDDDTATVTIARITDGNETGPVNAVFRVTQTAQATVDTIITYTTGGTATSGSDYTAPSGSVTILAGQTTADVTVAITNDAIVEATETLSLTLTGFTARDADVSLGATVLATANITDNDTATVTLARITDAAEPSTNGLFRVTQTAFSSTDTTVTYAVTGTAASGTDFTALSGSVTILAGQTTADISVPVIDENLVEGTETVIATLNGFSARDADISLGATVAATVTITDNDTATVTLAKITDGVEAAVPTNAVFRVTQTNPASVDTVVTYSVGGTATAGFDYTTLTGFVTILAGNTTADITVPVLNENVVEATETVSLTLNGFTARDPEVTLGATLTASADITDSDTSVITLAAVSADKNEGTGGASTAFTFSATLSNPVQGGFTIAYSTNNGTALAGSDYTDNDSTLNFTGSAGEAQTITVSVTHDGTNEIDEAFTVALGSITGLSAGIPAGNVTTAGSPQTGTIRNDDALTITITAPDADADENTAGIGIWRVSRNGVLNNTTVQLQIDASSTAVPADWTQGGATFGSLVAGSTGTIVIPGGATFIEFSLTPTGDLHAEAAETVRVNVTADAGYTIGSPANATVTIGQNDFLVINTNNAGEGTLRQAVLNANALVGDDTIAFSDGTGGTVDFTDATADTIALSGGEITLASDLTIAGTGANVLVLQNTQAAGTTSRVFNIASGLVRLRGLTITGGNATTDGGGIQIAAATNVTLVGCSVSGNSTTAFGGGISSSAFSLSIVSSTISGNSAAGVNTAGGIHTTSTTFTLLNSTLSGNSSTSATGNNVGGILGNGTMINCTVTNNSVANPDPAFVGGVGGGFTISNSLIAGNVANTTRPDIGGFFTSNGGNIIGNVGTATGFTATNDLKGTGVSPINPFLGPLQDNGGPTLTHMLLNGSPAINNGLVANLPADTLDLDGDLNVAEALPVDQRGGVNLRQRGPAPDAGAVEAFAFEPTITASTTDEDTQSTSGLVVSANTADGGLTTHFKITGILNGTLFQNDGTTAIAEGSYITKAEGAAGLKFTPSLNLNTPNTPAGFGFSAQAAISTAAGDERGVAVPVVITVNSINDLPTVVAPGLPDIRLTIGDVVVIPLGANFADVDLQTLTFTVSGNTVPAKASATITGTTNVTVTGLTYGVTDLTIQADDGAMGLVTDTFQVAVGTVEPTAATLPLTSVLSAPGRPYIPNPQTAAFDFDVSITNTTAFDINGIRLLVDLSMYNALPPLQRPRLVNFSSPVGVTPAYVDYPYPVAIGNTVTLRLTFFVSSRVLPVNFAPGLVAQKYPFPSDVPGPMPAVPFVDATIQLNTGGAVVLTWPSVVGQWYRIYYSDTLAPNSWLPSATPLRAESNQTQWIDSGAPFTIAPPGAARFYRVSPITPP